MKIFCKHGQALFMDSTYRLNCEHFCLYCILVEDENGFGQPVAMAFLRDEKKNTLERLFEIFKERNNDSVEGIQCIFVDKDFAQIAALEKSFPASPVLLCAFHTMKAWKTKIATQKLSQTEKQELLAQFKRVLHADSMNRLEEEERKLEILLPDAMAEYYSKHWKSRINMWAFAYQKSILAFGNRTTNRIERFFLMVKSAFRNTGRSVWTRYHLKDCVEIILRVVSHKLEIAKYEGYVNKGKALVLHGFPSIQYAESVGRSLTKIAALIVQKQFMLMGAETYEVLPSTADEWSVTNTTRIEHRTYDLIRMDERYTCSCYTNCSFGLPCRHILYLRKSNGEDIFSLNDVITKWHRGSNASELERIPEKFLDAALEGVPDEVLECERTEISNQNFPTIGKRFSAAKDICNRIASMAANFGGNQFKEVLTVLTSVEESLTSGCIPTVRGSDTSSKSPLACPLLATGELVLRSSNTSKPKGRPNEGGRFKKFNKKNLK
ncbi:zinc finger SWIM domain-containing protein 3-like isoform X2 [Paramacrobiotus metropolitanus]|nr:zinc finger SWIM domain-containing protein 3-like isoform X2 [Paramacrobiotus metropolitanus]